MHLENSKFRRNHQKKSRQSYRKQTFSQEIKKSIRSLTVATGVLVLLLSVLYFHIASESLVKGYTLKKLQEENNQLYYQNKILDGQIVEAKTFSNIEKDQTTKEMVSAENVEYVKNSNVARRSERN